MTIITALSPKIIADFVSENIINIIPNHCIIPKSRDISKKIDLKSKAVYNSYAQIVF